MDPSFPPNQPNVYNINTTPLPHSHQIPPTASPASTTSSNLTKAQRRMLGESEAARAKRLTKNAERMRQKRASETYEEYKLRLAKNAETNRRRRQNETEAERALRHMRNAMRQRLRRAMEAPEQKIQRKAKLAQRMREKRASETPEQRKLRLEKGAARARHKFLTESSEERLERNRKKAEYARMFRGAKQHSETEPTLESEPAKNLAQNAMDVKTEQLPTNSIDHAQHNQIQQHSDGVYVSREQNYHPVKNYPINYPDFGAAFPTFFNYSHLKNSQQNAYTPVCSSQSYYPELTVPSHYMKHDRTLFQVPKSSESIHPQTNLSKETHQKN